MVPPMQAEAVDSVTQSTNRPGAERHNVGPAILETGRPSEPWCSTRSRATATLRPYDGGDNYLDAHRWNDLKRVAIMFGDTRSRLKRF